MKTRCHFASYSLMPVFQHVCKRVKDATGPALCLNSAFTTTINQTLLSELVLTLPGKHICLRHGKPVLELQEYAR
jgi:hypothetical protein